MAPLYNMFVDVNIILQKLIVNIPQILLAVTLFGYACYLHRIIGKKMHARTLGWAFVVIALLGVLINWKILGIIADGCDYKEYNDYITMFLVSIRYSLEMFIGKTIIFKLLEAKSSIPLGLYYFHIWLYWLAIITSCLAIFHIVSRWLHNRKWLRIHSKEADLGNAHIFIGFNAASQKLAADIQCNFPTDTIIFIDLPDEEDKKLQGITVLDIISRFFKDSKESENLNSYVVLKAGKGLKKLVNWLECEKNKVYILSDSQELNMQIFEELWENPQYNFKCKIYCHAKREGLIKRYETIPDKDDRVNFIDSSFLAVEYLKKDESGQLLPVNYVDIATDPNDGARLAYVTSGFNCAIIGFGETGREAMKFLYEYGAFPNKEKGKAQFACHIYDEHLNNVVGDHGLTLETLQSSATTNKEFYEHECEIGSSAFWSIFKENINELNYVVVCLGNDKLNLETAINIAESAFIEGRTADNKLCIAVKMSELSTLDKATLKNANDVYGNCIHEFGMLDDIWKWKVISNEEMNADAKKFFESYMTLTLKLNAANNYTNETWEDRMAKLHSVDYRVRCAVRRKIMQDYSNCFHKYTKQLLCKGAKVNIDDILPVNEDAKHSKGKDTNIFEYLAICEHLRWEASHLLLGYRKSDDTKDDIKKLHNCIKPYAELSETVKHFDWLVVKNSVGF